MWVLKRQKGFTIVELLIVIVVIGILAAITIVAYNGITAKANQAAAQASVEQASKSILSYMVQNSDQVPPDLATANVGFNGNATYQYTTNTTVSPQTFCVTAIVSGKSYYVDNSGHTSATSGTCTIINLATNPKLDTAATGYTSAGSVTSPGRNAITGLAGFSFGYTGSVSANSDRLLLGGSSSLVVGQVYVASIWAKDTAGATFAIQATDGAGTQYAIGTTTTATGSWQRLNVSFTPNLTTWRVVVRQISATAGTLSMTGVMVTQGSSVYNYADGDTSGWSWTGTAGNSTSSGPSV